MADISKCQGSNCKKRDSCYRYLAPSSKWQSYFSEPPLNEDGKCDYYWESDYKAPEIKTEKSTN